MRRCVARAALILLLTAAGAGCAGQATPRTEDDPSWRCERDGNQICADWYDGQRVCWRVGARGEHRQVDCPK
jgi:hypothetical protein